MLNSAEIKPVAIAIIKLVWLPKPMPRLHVAGVQVIAWTWDFFLHSKVSVSCLFRTPYTQAFSLSKGP